MNVPIVRQSVAALMRPESVALIGASPDPTSYPGKVLGNLLKFGFAGRVYAVTPRHPEINGIRCCPSPADLPEKIDVALILVSARTAPAALEQAVAAGAKAAVVFSAGMAEIGADGAVLERQLATVVETTGARVLGPNCLGCLNVGDGVVLSGAAALERETLIGGAVGIAAQSGGVMGSLLDRAWSEGIGVSCAFSTGNEVDLDLAECVEFMAADARTRVIALFIETIRDVARFRAACTQAAASGKPVVALKIGRSKQGAQVALTHTASLVGNDQAWDALFRQLGVVRVDAMDDLFLTSNLLANASRPPGRRLAVACTSGGLAGHAADLCAAQGVTLAELHPATIADISALQVGFGGANNPLDITGHTVSREN